MKTRNVILCIVIVVNVNSYAQKSLRIIPGNPNAGQTIEVLYNASQTPLSSSIVVSAKAYMFSTNGRFIKTVDVPLSINNINWVGKLELINGCVAFNLLFKDEHNTLDNNQGNGYTILLKNVRGEDLKGAKASVAKHCFVRSNFLKLQPDFDKARVMMQEEFEANEDLLPHYIFPYHYTFDLTDSLKKSELIRLLDMLYVDREKFDEYVLYDLSRLYGKLQLKNKAENCTKTMLKIHPNGEMAFQLNSRSYQEEIRRPYSTAKKIRIYKQMGTYFKENLYGKDQNMSHNIENTLISDFNSPSPSYKWAKNQMYCGAIQLISLNHVLKFCLDQDALAKWMELVEQTETELIKMMLYDKYSQACLSRGEYLGGALEVSTKASDWALQQLGSPRTLRESTGFAVTDHEIEINRRIDYARFLMTKGELLGKLNKNKEALDVCNEVIANSNLSDIRINDRIVSLLLDTKHHKEAMDISKIAISKGKASTKINELVSNEDNDNGIVDSISNNHLVDINDYLASIRINKVAPAFELKNIHGENVSLSNLKNKIVVLDFWATWCGPCIMSFPAYQEIIKKYKTDTEVVFLFINLDKDKKDIEKEIKQFLNKRKYDFEVLLDKKGISSQAYSVSGLPTKFVIDKYGVINFRSVGAKKNKEALVEELSLMIEMARTSKTF